jgi:hypothetical protein
MGVKESPSACLAALRVFKQSLKGDDVTRQRPSFGDTCPGPERDTVEKELPMRRLLMSLPAVKSTLMACAALLAGVTVFLPGVGGFGTVTAAPSRSSAMIRTPADLAATHIHIYHLEPSGRWLIRGVVENLGGHPFTGSRTVTLQQVTRSYFGRPHDRVVTLANQIVTKVDSGGWEIGADLPGEPQVGTRFRLIISPGDFNVSNDQLEITYFKGLASRGPVD